MGVLFSLLRTGLLKLTYVLLCLKDFDGEDLLTTYFRKSTVSNSIDSTIRSEGTLIPRAPQKKGLHEGTNSLLTTSLVLENPPSTTSSAEQLWA